AGATAGSVGLGGLGGLPGTIGAGGAGGAGGLIGPGGNGGNGGDSSIIFSGDNGGNGGTGGNGSIGGTGGNGGDGGSDPGGNGGNGGNSYASGSVGGAGGAGGISRIVGGNGGNGGSGTTTGGAGGAGGVADPGQTNGTPGAQGPVAGAPPSATGSPGAPGAPGTPGPQAPQGASGAPVMGLGANGLDRSTVTGAQGSPGTPGTSQTQTRAGSLGAGSSGVNGADGLDGNPAANGAPGTPGNPGTKGLATGINGANGSQGLAGSNITCSAVAGYAGLSGLGGTAIVGVGNTAVINDGTIAGGWNFGQTVQADAVIFSSGGNRMEIWDDSIIEGDVLTDNSVNDTFALGGDENGTFDVRDLVATATTNNGHTEYQGFDIFEKTGVSTWTLTHTTPQVTPWTIYNGVMSTSEDGNLGALAGDLTIDGGTWQVTGTAFATTTRDVVLADTSERTNGIDIAAPTNIFEYNLAITGSGGLQKLGLGTLELNGVSSYLGQTDVMQGTLVIGDSLANNHASVVGNGYLAPGATLAGHGTIGGNVWNDGTVAPGNNDIGTLTLRGNYNGPANDSHSRNGTIAIELDGNPGKGVISDHLKVDGQVYLNGTTLLLLKRDFEMVCGDKTQVIISDKANFHGEINPLSLAHFDKLMLFDNGTGWLYGVNVLKTQDLSDLPGLNANQKAIAKSLSLDVLTPSNFIDDDKPLDQIVLKVIEDCPLIKPRIDLLSPESYASFGDYAIQVTRNYTRTAMGIPGPGVVQQPRPTPVVDSKGGMVDSKGSMVDSKGGMADAKGGLPSEPCAPAARTTTVFGAFSHYDASSNSSINGADYDINSNGGIAGIRHSIDNLTFGGFIGIDEGQVSSAFVNADVSGYVLGGFISYLANAEHNVIIDGGLTYGSYQFDGTRNTLTGLARFDGGDTDVFDVFASVRADVYKTDKLRLSPMLSVHYLQANVDAVNESGPITALAVNAMDQDALFAEISLNAEYRMSNSLTWFGSIGYTHNFMDAERLVSAKFIYGNTPFSVIAPGLGQDLFSVGVGAVWNVTDALSIGANYRAEFGSDSNLSNAVAVSLSYSF
ncbi:MAG: autotransporter domain-containing protein, partial [Verrucomicrobiota bacterium]